MPRSAFGKTEATSREVKLKKNAGYSNAITTQRFAATQIMQLARRQERLKNLRQVKKTQM